MAEKIIETKAIFKDYSFAVDGGILITFRIPPEMRSDTLLALDNELIKEQKEIALTLEKLRKKRSLNANDYLWVLCTKLSEKLRIPKEEIYREHIRQMGQYEPLAILSEAVDHFTYEWSKRGIGWFCEVVDSSLNGCKKIFAYYGSSTYDTKEMSLLIDSIVEECKSQGIQTMTPEEIENLKKSWKAT